MASSKKKDAGEERFVTSGKSINVIKKGGAGAATEKTTAKKSAGKAGKRGR
jgi:hypothetical protein